MKRALCVVFGLAAPAASALAQDFGTEWIDRVTHEMQEARGPLNARPVSAKIYVGGEYYYDTNVFLESTNPDADSVLIPFGRARVDYAEPQFEAVGDLLVDYKRYFPDRAVSHDEERFFGRARFVGSRLNLELVELLRHESDPVDAVFAARTDRLVLDSIPRVEVDFNRWIGVEALSDIQLVTYREAPLRPNDNVNIRADLAGVFHGSNGIDFMGQLGYIEIDYFRSGGPPNARGYYARAGARGDLVPRLHVEGLLGYTRAYAANVPGSGHPDDRTMDASIHLRYELLSVATLYADYTRMITFAGGTESFQIVNRWVGIAELQATPTVVVGGRVQFDHVDGALGSERIFFSAGVSSGFTYNEKAVFDVGLTFRRGDADLPGGKFNDLILHVGVVFSN